jgi:hypothetical protein
MELFSPCTRHREILESQGDLEDDEEVFDIGGPDQYDIEQLQELKLDVSIPKSFSALKGALLRGLVRDVRKRIYGSVVDTPLIYHARTWKRAFILPL